MKYFIPKNIQEALEILSFEKNIKILAGGTDLIVDLKENKIKPHALLDLSGLNFLNYIKLEKNLIKIGALTLHAQIIQNSLINQYAGVLKSACEQIGSPQIKNKGTIGGNIVQGSPAGDTLPALLVLESKLKLLKKGNFRIINLEDFLIAPNKSMISSNEILSEIIFKKNSSLGFFAKIGQRNSLAVSKVSLALQTNFKNKKLNNLKAALGAVAPKAIRAYKLEEFLNSKKLSLNLIKEASLIIEKESLAISDLRSNAKYRTKMLGVLLRRCLIKCLK
ncbi:MAG: FAD binding domain-containing protein [Armatimonadetes bacterium]|nr:FAD binding domain-containing protein [Armatimonadota bacterium]